MPDHAGFAASVAVSERVLRIAAQTGYANGSEAGRRLVQTLVGGAPTFRVEFFLGQLDIQCEEATNRLILILPLRGKVKVTKDQVDTLVGVRGEMEFAIAPEFQAGPTDSPSSIVLNPNTEIVARRWTATVTSTGIPPDIAALVTGEAFRTQFEVTFKLGLQTEQFTLPSIDASFLGPLVRKATEILARVRDDALVIGVSYTDATHALAGNVDDLQDFTGIFHVAGAIHPAAADVLLDEIRTRIVQGAEDAGASLGSFSITARDGHFRVSGAVSDSGGTVHFSFRVVPRMFHTRPGKTFTYLAKPRRVHGRTWPALDFGIESVETEVERSWFLILVEEVLLGILTLGFLTVHIEGELSWGESTLSGQIKAGKAGSPNARIRRTIPPPGGIALRIGLDQFDVSDSGVAIRISVRAKPSPAVLFGPTTVPENYRDDTLRYILRPPSGVSQYDPELRIHWILRDFTNGVVLQDSDGPAVNRLTLEFSPASIAATDFGIEARLYRRNGSTATDIETRSVRLHMRPPLAPGAYVRWRWAGLNPQVKLDEPTETWSYQGERRVWRYSDWHRTDAPCRAVDAPARYRFEHETVDKLPFSLRLLQNRRNRLCPYCFYGGPAGVNPNL